MAGRVSAERRQPVVCRHPPARRGLMSASPSASANGDTDADTDAGTGHGTDADRGAVTVEAALALCSLVLFLALAVGAISAVGASVRCTDAARELARLGARGEPDRGHLVAARLAPAGAVVSLNYEGDLVVAEVSAAVLKPLPLQVGGRAVAAVEPGARGA